MDALVVEDDAATRELVVELLAELGDTAIEAADGKEAWQRLQDHPVPLIITDWMMPRVDGKMLIHAVREAGFEHYTYIIMLTARGADHATQAALAVDADDYIEKPIDPDLLQRRIQEAKRIIQRQHAMRNHRDRLARVPPYDDLTQLLNQDAILSRAQAVLRHVQQTGQHACLVLAEVDQVAQINRRYGSEVGDQVLRHIGGLMRGSLRSYDAVGRWEGATFLLVLRSPTPAEAVEITNRLRYKVAQSPLELPDGEMLPVSLSFGLANCVNHPGALLDELLMQARAALHLAKREGKNSLRSFSDMGTIERA